MKNTKKKGFTLVELLVVIAILAVLATVSIVGYTSFIAKANRSADEQAIEQINTYLEGVAVSDRPATVEELWAQLNETGLNAEDYKPLSKDHFFFWDKDTNRVYLVNADDEVVYPAEYANETMDTAWYTLTGKINLDEAPTVTDNAVAIGSASDLITTIEKNMDEVQTMNVSGALNMLGASTFIPQVDANLTIQGSNNAQIINITSTEYAYAKKDKGDVDNDGQKYGAGVVGTTLSTNGEQTITIKDMVFDGITMGSYDTGSAGIICGLIAKGDTLILENVTIKNCTVYGQNKVGIICGSVQGTIIMKNVKVENCTVNSAEGESGKLFGVVFPNASVTADAACSVNNTTVNNEQYDIHEFVTVGDVKYVTKNTGKGEAQVVGNKVYVCRCATANSLAWVYGADYNTYTSVGTVGEKEYIARPATEITDISAWIPVAAE